MGNNLGMKIAGIAGVVAVIGGGCAAAYAFSDTVKNQVKLSLSKPEDYYEWVYEKNIADLSDCAAKSAQEQQDRRNNGSSATVSLKLEPSAELKDMAAEFLGDSDDDASKQIKNIVQNASSVALTADAAVRGNSAAEKLAFLLNDEQIVSAELMADMDGSRIFGRVPELSERWVTADIGEAMAEAMDGAKVVLRQEDMPQPQEIGDMIGKYCNLLIQEIGDITVEKKQPVPISGLTVDYTALKGTITEEKVLDTLQNLLDTATVDTTLEKMVPDSESYQQALLDAGDQLRELREYGLGMSNPLEVETYVDATGTIRGYKIWMGTDFNFFGAVGMSGDQLAAEAKFAAGESSGFKFCTDATRSGEAFSGTGMGSISTYGDEAEEIGFSYSDLKIVDAKNGYFSGNVTLKIPDESIGDINLQLTSDGSSQSITYPMNIEGKSIGNLIMTYAVHEGGEASVPDRSGAYEVDVEDMDFEIQDYVTKDELKNFIHDVMSRLGFDDNLIPQVTDEVDYIYE